MSAPGRRGGTGRDEARRGAPLPPATGGGPARPARCRRARCARRRPGIALSFAAALGKLAGTGELSAPGRTRVRSRDSRGRPGCTCPCRQPWHGTSRSSLLLPPGQGGARCRGRSSPTASGAARRAGCPGGAEPGRARAVPPSGAMRGGVRALRGRCAARGPPRGAFQPHDIMGTGGARPIGAGPAQTRIVRPPRPARGGAQRRRGSGRGSRGPRPAGSPASGDSQRGEPGGRRRARGCG